MNQNNQYLRFRLLLTVLWIIFFLAALGICESYIHVLKDGKVYMTFSERPLYLKPICLLYAPYIAGILAFWFLNPFPPCTIRNCSQVQNDYSVWCYYYF